MEHTARLARFPIRDKLAYLRDPCDKFSKLLSIPLKADMFVRIPFIEATRLGEQIRDAWISVVHTHIPFHSRRESLLLLHIHVFFSLDI